MNHFIIKSNIYLRNKIWFRFEKIIFMGTLFYFYYYYYYYYYAQFFYI